MEIDLSASLPPKAISPFSKELAARAARRVEKAAKQKLQEDQDLEVAQAQLRAAAGPSFDELKVTHGIWIH